MRDTKTSLTRSVTPTDTNEKCVQGQGEGYRGTWSISHSGAECINWNATSLRGRSYTATKVDASSLGLGNHNFCRHVQSAKCRNICRNKLQIFIVSLHLKQGGCLMFLNILVKG